MPLDMPEGKRCDGVPVTNDRTSQDERSPRRAKENAGTVPSTIKAGKTQVYTRTF